MSYGVGRTSFDSLPRGISGITGNAIGMRCHRTVSILWTHIQINGTIRYGQNSSSSATSNLALSSYMQRITMSASLTLLPMAAPAFAKVYGSSESLMHHRYNYRGFAYS